MNPPLAALLLSLPLAQGGAVATSEPHASAAAAELLAAGGNAVDAAVGAAFALAVSYPAAGNLGGGGFLLYRPPEGGVFFLDFREVAPAAARPDLYLDEGGRPRHEASLRGWLAVAVPGSVPGLAEAHRRWGSLPWWRDLAPALRLAAEGIPLSAAEHARLQRAAHALGQDPLAAAVFLDSSGNALAEGELLLQPRLAESLRLIMERGGAAFRDGPLVEGMLAASRAGGGILAAADFRDYRPLLRPVHAIPWRDCTLYAPSLPSSGGVFLSLTLAALEPMPLRLWGWEDPRGVLAIAEAEARAFAIRNRWLGDPAGLAIPAWRLIGKRARRNFRASIQPGHWTPPALLGSTPPVPEGSDTTHFSIVDAAGGACAVTTTLNGSYGAKVMAPGGFLMNDEMDDFAVSPGRPNQFGLVQGEANRVRPGRRPLSSMSPVIVERNGRLDAVFGSPGGPTILTTVLQVFLNRYAYRMDPERAVAAPRFHRQDLPATLQYELGRFGAPALAALRDRGQPLRRRASLGDVNAVFRVSEGWKPVSDPRREGSAIVIEDALLLEADLH